MEMSRATELLNWNKNILTILGIWPCDPHDFRFTISFGYLLIHVSLEYANLLQRSNTFEHIVTNLTENITYSIIAFQVLLLRLKSRLLRKVIDAIHEDYHENNYENPAEKRVFLAYYETARTFFQIAVPMVFSTAISYYLVPLGSLLGNSKLNGTQISN